MTNITPIQTKFDGRFFRSRTEARWAVFFKALGWPYEYEKEGFDLGGTWYLPDFWLTDLEAFLEVKGETATQEEIELCRKLSMASSKYVFLVVGQPQEMSEQWMLFLPSGFFVGHQALMADRRNKGEYWLQRFDEAGNPNSREWIGPHVGKEQHDRDPIISPELSAAYAAALSERFAA